MSTIDDCDNIEDLTDFLVRGTSDRTTQEASADALLVFEFFPTLGPEFQNSPEILKDQIESFKEGFEYSKFGLDRDEALDQVKDIESIEKVFDTLARLMSQEIKEQLMKRYLKEIWFEQNSNSDFNHFKSSLDRDYWQS